MKFNVPEEYKNTSGVYMISSSVDSRVYIGSTVDLYERYKCHHNKLIRWKHENLMLQEYAQNLSDVHMEFSVLEYCERNLLLERETHYIMEYKAVFAGYGFNVNTNGLNLKDYDGPEKLNKHIIPLIKQKIKEWPHFDIEAQMCPECRMWLNVLRCDILDLKNSLEHVIKKWEEAEQTIAQLEARLTKRKTVKRIAPLVTNQLCLF